MNAPARGEIRGVHVLAAMLAFFGTVIAINVAFSVAAIRTFPGEDEPHSYVQGLRYNETLAARAEQTARGWRAVAGMAPGAAGVVLRLRFVDHAGAPLDRLSVTGVLRRPSTARDDRALAFAARGDGLYTASAGRIGDGVWVFQGAATREGARLDIERRMTWRSPATR